MEIQKNLIFGKKEAMSNTKTDQRVKLTIQILQNALIKCMLENHISKISVKRICDIAGINRSTFYSHFQDQYDLLDYTCNKVIENIKKYMDEYPNKIKPISHSSLTRILDYIKEDADLFNALLSDNSDLDIQKKIMKEFITYQPYNGLDLRTKEYFYAYGQAGCISIIQKWLKDGMPETTARMAEIILHALMPAA